jgi:hypothetical protein
MFLEVEHHRAGLGGWLKKKNGHLVLPFWRFELMIYGGEQINLLYKTIKTIIMTYFKPFDS